MKSEIVIRADQAAKLTKISDGAGKFAIQPTAEKKIILLFQMKAELDEFIEQVKVAILEAGRRLTTDFKGVTGEKVKAYVRTSGLKYGYDKKEEKKARPFLKEVVTLRPDTEKIEAYREKYHELPPGILENERKEGLIISIKEEEILLP